MRPIAHRGLHDHAQGRLENTAPAFRAAIQKHYGIECDLQAAEDGTPMVFHDPKLDRLVDASGPIAAYTPSKLAKFRYKGQKEKILTFAQFLELVHGRVPLLVEVKVERHRGARRPSWTRSRAPHAAYHGPIALMSFNRTIVTELSVRAPKVPRGCVVGSQQILAGLVGAAQETRRSGRPRLFAPSRDGIGFYAVDVKLAAVAQDLDDAQWPRPAAVCLDGANAETTRDGCTLGRRADLRGLRGLTACRAPYPRDFRFCLSDPSHVAVAAACCCGPLAVDGVGSVG